MSQTTRSSLTTHVLGIKHDHVRSTFSSCSAGFAEAFSRVIIVNAQPEISVRFALQRRLSQLVNKHGFNYYFVGTHPVVSTADIAGCEIISNWPNELLNEYSTAKIFSRSIFAKHARTSVIFHDGPKPLFPAGRLSPATRSLSDRFSAAGLIETIACAPYSAMRKRYIFLFSGVAGWSSGVSKPGLIFDVLSLMGDLYVVAGEQAPELTDRELECLGWSAAGKNSKGIAQILALSSFTIDGHIKSAMQKLNAVNRAQAVAKACRFGLL